MLLFLLQCGGKMKTEEEIRERLERVSKRRDELWNLESIMPVMPKEYLEENYYLSVLEDCLEWVLKN